MKAIIIEQDRLRELFDNFKLILENKASGPRESEETTVPLRTATYHVEMLYQKIESSK